MMLPRFENEIPSRKSSSIKLSVGIGVVRRENSPSVIDDLSGEVGVLGGEFFTRRAFLHRLPLPELPLFVTFSVVSGGLCSLCSFVDATSFESKLTVKPSALSSIVFTDPSLAAVEVVGARPESLFDSSLSSSVNCRRRAGWISRGGARGGATVMGIGALALVSDS